MVQDVLGHLGDAETAAPIPAEAVALARFLRQEAESIAQSAASQIAGGLPFLGVGAKRRLRHVFTDQLRELARHLENYGYEGPRIYGESHRRYAAARLAQGLELHEMLEERAILNDATLRRWQDVHGDLPIAHARLMAQAYAEVTSQAAEVWLTYQRAESAAFQEAALLATIVHNLDEAILVFEPDGLVSYVTPALERILGMPPRFFVGTPRERLVQLLRRLEPRDEDGNLIEPEEFPYFRAIATRTMQHRDAVRMRRLDGQECVVELHAAPVFTEDGELRGVVATVRDRTESYEQTAALEQAYEELRTMHARLLARSRLEAVGELSGSAAHALNNQLNVIALLVRRLRERPETEKEAQGIQRAVREIARVVSRLQEFAAAPQPGAPTRVDPGAVVEEALRLIRAEPAQQARAPIESELPELPPVLAEREILLEFITAIFLGSRDSSPPDTRVRVEGERIGDRVALRIHDHGPPLDEEHVEFLFNPILRGAASRAISLALGRQAVLRWGGEVHVFPRDGEGNTFELLLPVFVEEAAPKAEPEKVAEAERGEELEAAAASAQEVRSVLVVDDDEDNAAMLADLIRDAATEPLEVHTAETGRAGIELAASHPPDVALVDLLLPDMQGWEVVRAIKERTPSARVAVVSGLAVGKEEQAERVDAVFRKPIDTDELLRFVGI